MHHVNKLPLLSSLSLRVAELRNPFCWHLLSTRHRFHSFAVLLTIIKPGIKNEIILSNPALRHQSRYSASTIMRPHTKTFSFADYDVIGFDLDGTILRYNLNEMVPLEYELLSKYLVECKGYSNRLLHSLTNTTNKDFWLKGLFLDAERGNILKLSSSGCILKANHGTKAMTDEEICATYGEKRQWSVTCEFIKNPLCVWNGPLAEKMRSLLDYFDISASLVFAHAVDDVDSRRHQQGNNDDKSYKVWPDILEALIQNYLRDHFSNGKSEYFKKLQAEPDRYLLKTSPRVVSWLRELKASKKNLFLLTGSHIDFANFTASYAMGENWKDLFDVVVCFARKPGFFHASRPFYAVEGFNETDPIPMDGELRMNSVYSMGNWDQLLRHFAKNAGKDVCAMSSLYVGDNLIQDVYAPTALSNIDSVAVSEEMLAHCSADNTNKFEFKDIIASNYWNSYFFHNGDSTLWTDVIEKYSRMCVPSLEHAAVKPIDYNFCMNNEHGFYPSAPCVE